jgi:hypothetical protein
VLDVKFSGFIDYKNTFTLPELTGKTYLDLGEVGQTAQIWINGKLAGSRIFAPFIFDISDQITIGINTIKVRVGNEIAVNAGQNIGKCGLMGSIVIKNESY